MMEPTHCGISSVEAILFFGLLGAIFIIKEVAYHFFPSSHWVNWFLGQFTKKPEGNYGSYHCTGSSSSE